jgi:hypothetical protein
MSPGAIEVKADGTLRLMPRRADHSQGLSDTVSLFAERVLSSDVAPRYRLSAASVWRGRRLGLSLEQMVETLERHSGQELPAQLRADLTRWSEQIGRLTLEIDQDRLVLRSAHPLVIASIMRHQTLGAFVDHQIDATAVVMRTETYPEVVAVFDACDYPVLDRVPPGWPPGTAATAPGPRHQTSRNQPQINSVLPPDFIEMVRPHLPRPCQATTRAGRPCKNRARPRGAFCRVHAHWAPDLAAPSPWPKGRRRSSHLLPLLLKAGVISHQQVALNRVSILAAVGLGAWLLHTLFVALGGTWLSRPLAAWSAAGAALLLTCGLLGRLVLNLPLFVSLHVVLDLLGSLLRDFGHKEGILVNLCFFVIPVVVPVAIVYHVGLGVGWGFLLFCLGLVIGQGCYEVLKATSEP